MEFFDYLKRRGIPNDVLGRMKDERIDAEAIQLMSDTQLCNYLPHEGDRIAARSYAERFSAGQREIQTSTEIKKVKKSAIFESLSKQMQFATKDSVCSTTNSSQIEKDSLFEKIRSKSKMLSGKKKEKIPKVKQVTNAMKEDMAIDVGFSVFSSALRRFKQVRSNSGGGTRYLRLEKPVSKQDIIKMAVPAFFPDGKGAPGSSQEFTFEIAADVAGTQLFRDDETAQEYMIRLKLKKMRCYLLATKIEREEIESEEIESEEIESEDTEFEEVGTEKMVADEMTVGEIPLDFPVDETDPIESTSQLAEETNYNDILFGESFQNKERESIVYDLPEDFVVEHHVVVATTDDSGTVQFVSAEEDVYKQTSNTVPVVLEAKVHRGQVCADFISFFMNEDNASDPDLTRTTVEVKMLKENGEPEIAEDNGGVIRDALTEFWETFYLQYCVGNNYVVPVIRHDMTKKHWRAVALIIKMGLRQEHIFPIKLAVPFMEQAIFGSCIERNLVESFLKFVPDMEKDVLVDSLTNFDSTDKDDLFEVMDNHQGKKNPNVENIQQIVEEMAHKELIQVPLYVADCWMEILRDMMPSYEDLHQVYADLKPNNKMVLKALTFPENMSLDESTLSNNVKKLIRELDTDFLSLFLRFCTGSDLLLKMGIHVRFIKTDVRCPTAHTCGCVLEIPLSYSKEPYIVLKSEFCAVLRNRYWQMDIV